MANITRLPFELAQAFDSSVFFDDFNKFDPQIDYMTYIIPATTGGAGLAEQPLFSPVNGFRVTSITIAPLGSFTSSASNTGEYEVQNYVSGGSGTAMVNTTYNAAQGSAGGPPNTKVPTAVAASIIDPVIQGGNMVTFKIVGASSFASPLTALSIGGIDLGNLPGGWAAYLPNSGNVTSADGQSGIVTLTPSDPNGTPAASDEAYLYTQRQLFQPKAGFPIYFEGYVQYSEANTNNAGVFVGIASGVSAGALITALSAGIRTSGTIVGFYKIAGGTTWHVIAQNGSGNSFSVDTGIPAGTSTYQRLTFEVLDVISGTATVVFRVDGELVRNATTPQVPYTVQLPLTSDVIGSLVAGVKNGSSTMETLNVDYLGIVQPRIVGADN